MPRAPNFTYQNPIGDIGNSLVRAMLGDPEAAAKQRQMQAEMDLRDAQTQQAQAHGELFRSQAAGLNTANAAQTGLPDLVRSWVQSQQPQEQQTVDSAGFADFDTPMPAVAERPDAATSLAALVASMGQMNGDKIDPRQIMGTLGAFGGGDELARRGMVAQGRSPDKDFAITADRADEIALNDAQAKQAQAWGVADRNHANDIPVANVRRKSAFDVATLNNRDDVPVALIGADSRRDVAGIKAAGVAPGFDAIANVFPGAHMNSGHRSVEHNREVGGVRNSTHLGATPGVQGYDIDAQPGMTVDQAAAAIEAKNPGVRVIEQRDEAGRRGPNGKALGGWHFALQNVGGPAKTAGAPAAAKPPKPVNKAGLDLVDAELKAYGVPGYDPLDRVAVRADAVTIFQTNNGNPVEAARKAVFNFAAKRRAQQGRSRPGDPGYVAPKSAPARPAGWGPATVVSAPPVAGARQSPNDGKWYVQTGTKGGKPTYARVD